MSTRFVDCCENGPCRRRSDTKPKLHRQASGAETRICPESAYRTNPFLESVTVTASAASIVQHSAFRPFVTDAVGKDVPRCILALIYHESCVWSAEARLSLVSISTDCRSFVSSLTNVQHPGYCCRVLSALLLLNPSLLSLPPIPHPSPTNASLTRVTLASLTGCLETFSMLKKFDGRKEDEGLDKRVLGGIGGTRLFGDIVNNATIQPKPARDRRVR